MFEAVRNTMCGLDRRWSLNAVRTGLASRHLNPGVEYISTPGFFMRRSASPAATNDFQDDRFWLVSPFHGNEHAWRQASGQKMTRRHAEAQTNLRDRQWPVGTSSNPQDGRRSPSATLTIAAFTMKTCIRLFAFAVLLSTGSFLVADELQVGVATTDITPGTSYPVSGYYHERLSTGVKDPLEAKAIVFRQGDLSAVFVVCDLITVASDLTIEVRKCVEQQTGIPGDHIIVAATHTHTGPDYTRELFSVTTGRPLPEGWKDREPYAAKLIDAVAAAVVNASEAAQPVKLLTGTAIQETPVAFHRRYLMKNGEYRTWIGLKDPNVLRTAGPIDPEIGILMLQNATSGKPTALLSSHALHLDTVGGTLWSADFPFFIERTLRGSLDGNLISLFGNGCCGNINHVNPNATTQNSAEQIGTALGQTIAAAIPQLTEITAPRLQIRSETIQLPLQSSTPEQLVQSKKLLREIQAGKKPDFYEHVDAYKRVVVEHLRSNPDVDETMSLIGWGLSAAKAGSGEFLSADLHVITLGRDFAIVALPGEMFVEYGLQIKKASPFRTTLVVELCNVGETIYVPTREAFLATSGSFAGGGYEVVNSTTLPGTGDLFVDSAVKLLMQCAHEVGD